MNACWGIGKCSLRKYQLIDKEPKRDMSGGDNYISRFTFIITLWLTFSSRQCESGRICHLDIAACRLGASNSTRVPLLRSRIESSILAKKKTGLASTVEAQRSNHAELVLSIRGGHISSSSFNYSSSYGVSNAQFLPDTEAPFNSTTHFTEATSYHDKHNAIALVQNISLYQVAHSLPTADVLEKLKTSQESGLSTMEAFERIRVYGKNTLKGKPSKSTWHLIMEQFQDRLVQILVIVATFSSALAFFERDIHAFSEPAVIFSIIFINALVGICQTKSAENSLDLLKKLQPDTTNVLRNGEWISAFPTEELVPGDIISVRVGDRISADARILRLKTTSFSTDEGSLTGESATVPKVADIAPLEASISGKYNMIFSGTVVSNGACLAIVVGTGVYTEMGKINDGLQELSLETIRTPLGKQLDRFGDQLTSIIGAICLLVWLGSIPRFRSSFFPSWYHGAAYYAKIAVALGVAAIPEGLPAVITLCLSLGTRRMAKRNVIVRNLPSVETLGCTSVICTDKTGTLTTNQMVVRTLVTFDADLLKNEVKINSREVSGVSYEPTGAIENFDQRDMMQAGFQDLATICTLCNDALLEYKNGMYVRTGEPTEAALKVLVEKMGAIEVMKALDPSLMVHQCSDHWESKYTKLATLEFDRERKSMSTLCKSTTTGSNCLFVKGAAELLIQRCSKVQLENGKTVVIDENLRTKLLMKVSEMARRPLRCLAVAKKVGPSIGKELLRLKDEEAACNSPLLQDSSNFAIIEDSLTLIGFCGILDPARPEAASSILKCREAGVRVIMITGDSKETAVSIARDVNIFRPHEDANQRAFASKEFFSLPILEQLELIKDGNFVFCRTEPRDKQRLISMLDRIGEIPAMTGDGVNDAPALKQAAIGIAMGVTGTEVAKDAADMILTDDNFSTIVSAIEEGRAIYNNMQSFICFLISTNIGEVLTILTATLLGIPEPLTPLHLLWVNFVTDGPPATALGFNPPDPDAMTKPPRHKRSTILSKWLVTRYICTGLYVGFATVGIFTWWYMENGVSFHQLSRWSNCISWKDFKPRYIIEGDKCQIFTKQTSYPQSLSLSVLVVMELMKALSAVSLNTSVLKLPPWKNKWLIPGVLFPALFHLLILYVPKLSQIFGLVPLTRRDWKIVFIFASPIILVEEIMKFFGRMNAEAEIACVGRKKCSPLEGQKTHF